MTVLLHDSLTRSRKPLPDGQVKLYVCGVTPYDTTHLGHAFTFVQFDALARALRWLGRDVLYVQNVTDIDDSILMRAHKLGVDWKTLGDEQTAQYVQDMKNLNVVGPDPFVRATDAMDTIVEMIQKLMDQGVAYVAGDAGVYFRVAAASDYGQLSGLTREQMVEITASQDNSDVDDPRKEDKLDFALWKFWTGGEDEPFWESPWGRGRPGWHIECSAMILQYLGSQVTIHGGGSDLIYPHHESEIAQSERATGESPFCELWLHAGMVRMDGEKMSKSLGNMVFIRDLIKTHSADAIRIYLLSHRYSDVFEWAPSELDAADSMADRLALAAAQPDHAADAREQFIAALEDDFNTPRAIGVLETASGATLRELGAVLGLKLEG